MPMCMNYTVVMNMRMLTYVNCYDKSYVILKCHDENVKLMYVKSMPLKVL